MSGLQDKKKNLEEYGDYCVTNTDKSRTTISMDNVSSAVPVVEKHENQALGDALDALIAACEGKIGGLFEADDKAWKTVNEREQLDWAYVRRWAKDHRDNLAPREIALRELLEVHQRATKAQRIARELDRVKKFSKLGRGLRAFAHASAVVLGALACVTAFIGLVMLNPIVGLPPVGGVYLFYKIGQHTKSEETLRDDLYGKIDKLSKVDETRNLGLTFGSKLFEQQKAKASEASSWNAHMSFGWGWEL